MITEYSFIANVYFATININIVNGRQDESKGN